mmetsp:Transcript_3334/g.9742  ORF Transcript_3334/g.9742 Transcript_3334/m.9742 type:complete len:295 (+) Transcript_3334:1016-1900(+)
MVQHVLEHAGEGLVGTAKSRPERGERHGTAKVVRDRDGPLEVEHCVPPARRHEDHLTRPLHGFQKTQLPARRRGAEARVLVGEPRTRRGRASTAGLARGIVLGLALEGIRREEEPSLETSRARIPGARKEGVYVEARPRACAPGDPVAHGSARDERQEVVREEGGRLVLGEEARAVPLETALKEVVREICRTCCRVGHVLREGQGDVGREVKGHISVGGNERVRAGPRLGRRPGAHAPFHDDRLLGVQQDRAVVRRKRRGVDDTHAPLRRGLLPKALEPARLIRKATIPRVVEH